jgi:hypothetical protein
MMTLTAQHTDVYNAHICDMNTVQITHHKLLFHAGEGVIIRFKIK